MLSPNLGMKTELAESGRLSDAAFASFAFGVDHRQNLFHEHGVHAALFFEVYKPASHKISESLIVGLRFGVSAFVTGLDGGVVNQDPLVGVGALVIGHHLPRSPNR